MIEIRMKYDVQDLRSIYFKDNDQKYFFGPKTKKQSIYLLIAIITYPFFALYALNKHESWFFILGSVLFSLFCYDFWRVAKPIMDWKKSVESFLKIAEKTEDLRFQYNENFFIYIQDQEELKQNWEVIEKAIVNEQYIWLFSDKNILLPKSSMTESEYRALIDLVLSKVKNVEKG